jgi:AraC family transcriptional regulator
MISSESLAAADTLPGSLTQSSWGCGWRSLLLKAFDEPKVAEEFSTRPTSDHLIVLVTGGRCEIEGRTSRGWQKASYATGTIGMTKPANEATLRWNGRTSHTTLHVHIPAQAVAEVLAELSPHKTHSRELPDILGARDPLIEHLMLSLATAARDGAPDVYAESAATMLAAHLFTRYGKLELPSSVNEDDRLRRATDYIRGNLSEALSLEAIAQQAGLSRFHLLRLFKRACGETPFQHITRLRIEEACRLLASGSSSISEIAFRCGYENPAHFASAFRRMIGASPTTYRSAHR